MSYGFTRELPFRIAFALLTGAYSLVRSRYARRVAEANARVVSSRPADTLRVTLLNYLGLAGSLASVVYIAIPQWMSWSAAPFPKWLRWAGGGLGFATTALFFWTHDTLGTNWSGTLVVREGHELITHGPYRWVRHPMYDAVVGTSLGGFLLTANWFIGLTGLGSTAILATRIRQEEAMMVEAFGDEYLALLRRTGRFVPLLVRPRSRPG